MIWSLIGPFRGLPLVQHLEFESLSGIQDIISGAFPPRPGQLPDIARSDSASPDQCLGSDSKGKNVRERLCAVLLSSGIQGGHGRDGQDGRDEMEIRAGMVGMVEVGGLQPGGSCSYDSDPTNTH